MSLGEYLGAGASTTKLLLHLNGNSTDTSGNSNSGTDTAITYSQANGRFGQGAGFNGSNSHIDLGSKFPTLTNNFTISFWIKPSATQADYASILGNHGNYQGITLQQNASVDNEFVFSWGDGTGWQSTSNFSLTASTWQFLTITKTSTSGTTVYVNGSSVATGANNNAVSPSTTRNIWIGQGYDGTGRYYAGNIDEVILENRVWSASEIKKYYTFAKGRFSL